MRTKTLSRKELFTTLAYHWERKFHFTLNNDPNIDIPALAAAGFLYFDRIIESLISCKYCWSHGEIFWHDFGKGPVCMYGCNDSDCRSTYAIDPETIKGWRVNDAIILKSLVESLGMKENITEVVTDEIWKLGRRQRREYFFIRTASHSNIPQIMAMFANQPKAVLICTRDADMIRRFMPHSCFSLYEIGTLDEEYRIVFDIEMIDSVVEAPPSVDEETAPKPLRASRAASIELLTDIMKDHIRAVCEHADYTGRSGDFQFIPRPTQTKLAEMAKIPQYEVSRCLDDKRADMLRLLWEKSEDSGNLEFLRHFVK